MAITIDQIFDIAPDDTDSVYVAVCRLMWVLNDPDGSVETSPTVVLRTTAL